VTHQLAPFVSARIAYARAVTGRRPARRRVPPAIHPTTVAVSYTRALLDLVEEMRQTARRVLYPRLQREVELAREIQGRTDAVDDEVGGLKADLLRGSFSKGNLRRTVGPLSKRVADHQKAQLQRQLRAAVGIDIPIQDPRLSAHIEAFTEANVGLITTIPEEALGQVQKVVTAGMQAGSRWEDIADAIEKRFKVAESRAALIARDQVAKFNSSLNETRQKALGITGFTWSCALDERTCPICGPLDGKSFEWKKPPAAGLPGQVHPNCRCGADPDVEGLLSSLEG
jgi:SPP1 gp7 family putative phage head morphogenesis protein